MEHENNIAKDHKSTLWLPMFMGIIFIVISFFAIQNPSMASVSYFDRIVFYLFMVWGIVLIWLNQLTRKYNYHKNIWLVIGVLTGPVGLIIFNIFVWFNEGNNSDADEDILDDF